MRTWTQPHVPKLPGVGQSLRLHNTATGRLEHVPTPEGKGTLYVCGITPYDATHLGHAFTYLTFDLVQRAWLDAGVEPIYAQNITDVDDPLLERAAQTGVNWKSLAEDQINLYRSDAFRLNMLPPRYFIAVTEVIEDIAYAVRALVEKGLAYEVPTPEASSSDLYFDIDAAQASTEWRLGDVAPYSMQQLLAYSAERGGDPERPGKRNPLDPLLWRAAREGEPSWVTVLSEGRPGWHIECAVIALDSLGSTFSVQGGGADLIFPHHELTAASASSLRNSPLAYTYVHAGLVGYQGEKMSKSRGNLVFVSKLLDAGYSGDVIRLALFAHHYREDWEFFDADVERAKQRLSRWRKGLDRSSDDPYVTTEVIAHLRGALANDLDTPVMLSALDAAWGNGVDDPDLLADACEALLGIRVKS